jgi:hypothetical protein
MSFNTDFKEYFENKIFDNTNELCYIMKKNGSDKGLGWHNYTTLYDYIFKNRRNDSLKIFELGLGTNNIKLPSNMGINGIPGASLRGWRDYFSNENSMIYGADIDKNILFNENRIKTYYCDQKDQKVIEEMWNSIPEKEFDIIVEDGLHEYDANVSFLINSFHKVKEGGIYIVEDLQIDTINRFNKEFSTEILPKLKGIKKFNIISIPNQRNNIDNNLFILSK